MWLVFAAIVVLLSTMPFCIVAVAIPSAINHNVFLSAAVPSSESNAYNTYPYQPLPDISEQLVLFPAGMIPGTPVTHNDSWGPADPANPIVEGCCFVSPALLAMVPFDNWYTNVTEPTLLPYLVDKEAPGRTDAAVIIAPGGGNVFMAVNSEGTDIAEWLNSIGISAFVLKYRVPSGSGANTLNEAQRAVSWVRHNAPQNGINVSRIGFMGFSTGGGLTQRVLTASQRIYPRIDEVDDVSHRPDFGLLIYPDMSGEQGDLSPPVFIAHALNAKCTDQKPILQFHSDAALHSTHKIAELHEYAGGGNCVGSCKRFPPIPMTPTCSWKLSAAVFLRYNVIGNDMERSDVGLGPSHYSYVNASVPLPAPGLAPPPRRSVLA